MTLLLALSPVGAATPCWGQAADDTTTAVARARFKEGVDFYDKGDFERARASFLQAYALKKHPAVLLNLAWSCLKSGHPLEAQQYFKEFPADSKDTSDKQRADAADGLNQSRTKLGRIEVIAAAGAEVTVDGGRIGFSPLADPVLVEPGAHTVKTKSADGTSEVQSVTVLAGEHRVARFGAAAAANAPSPPPPAASTPALAVASEATHPRALEEHANVSPAAPPRETFTERSFFPTNMVPVYIGGILTLAGAGAAIAMLEFKQQALDAATSTTANIRSQGRACPAPTATTDARLLNACSILSSDNDNINTDATIGNVMVGVALAGLVGTIGYWIFADKTETAGRLANETTIVPLVGRSVQGLAVAGRF